MRITPPLLHRYLGYSLGSATLAAVAGFVFLLITGNLLKDVMAPMADGRLPVWVFFQLVALLVPYVAAYAFPLGLLTAVLMVFGRLSAQLEITAMRAAGISLRQVGFSALVLALIAFCFAVFVNFYSGPNSRDLYRQILADTVQKRPLQFITAGQFIRDFPNVIIYIEEKDEERLRGIRVWEFDRDGQLQHQLTSASGTLRFDESEGVLFLSLERGLMERRQGEVEGVPRISGATFAEWGVRLPLQTIFDKPAPTRRLSRMDIFMLMDRLDSLPAEARQRGHAQFNEWVSTRLEINERLAMSFATISLTLLAVPLSIRLQRRETAYNFLAAFFVAIGFYLMMILFSYLAVRPAWRPDYLIWIPNLIVLSLAMFFFRKVERL